MLEVAERMRRIAPSLAAVMIVGESGTGKEVAAQMLHLHSARSSGPFVSVNCGAIPANLVEAELFGYERGAFTGAVRQHQGYFERASGGTLFLDEITEMPIDLQAKLLRVLESGRMVRVGGTDEIAVDVRVVTATNRPPTRPSAIGACARTSSIGLRCSWSGCRRCGSAATISSSWPTRSSRSSTGENGTAKRFDPASLAVARAHPWPGNVRELKNCVERSYVLCRTTSSGWTCSRRSTCPSRLDGGDCVRLPIGTTMADAERELLLATLRHCGGNKRRTADVLGVSLKTVYNKLVGYGIAAPMLRTAGEA